MNVNTQLTARDMFNDEFNPLDINISEIKSLSQALPGDGNIDLNNAEVLATKYLRGADLCSDILAIATAHAQKCDTLKKKAYSYAALVKSAEQKIKTDKSRAWFADTDEDYIQASNNYTESIAFVKWVGSKMDSFIKMHYLCRSIVKRGMDQEGASGWSGKGPENEEEDGW